MRTGAPPIPVIGQGATDRDLSAADIRRIVGEAFDALPLDGQRVLVIIPDATRTMPMAVMREALEAAAIDRVVALDYLVALGTHQPMSDDQLTRLIGRPVVDGRFGSSRIVNHRWDDPSIFVSVGRLPAAEVETLSHGLLSRDIEITLNGLIFQYDQVIVCGPVFPHEVAGFSGGSKYIVPGIAGSDIIDFTHWLGAVRGNYHTIGRAHTPVRAVIERAAAMVDVPIACFALVVTHEGVSGLYFGSIQDSWRAAADLSARKHVVYLDRPVRRVLSMMPEMYADLWTAAKGMYKLEPAVADGGEIVIFAPHITEVSYTHGRVLDEIGYHCRDYFIGQWSRFAHYPGGILAHSTHVKGLGKYDAATGVETPRIRVTLATGIPEARCRRINLGYVDPATVNPEEWGGREDEGVLLVRRAGEILYQLRQAAQPADGDTAGTPNAQEHHHDV